MDLTDLTILKLLQQDARITHKEIAAKLNMTITPIYERIKKLERQGVIKKYVALMNAELLDKSLVAFTTITLKEHSKAYIKKFELEITSIPEVVECFHLAGQFDYLLKIITHDMKAYQRVVIDRLASMENISNVISSFVLTEVVHTTEIPLD